MRVVIDTNCLESEELRLFLKSRPTNMAVLPEHTVAEIFKPNSIEAVVSSFSVLRDYPRQVLILRGNRVATEVNPRASAISNHFIDRKASREFPKFCEILRAVEQGDTRYRQQLLQRQRWAQERADTTEEAFGDQAAALAELSSNFTANDLRQIRSGQQLSTRSKNLILALTAAVAEDLHAKHSEHSLQSPPHLYYHFTWRYALAHIVQLMDLVRKGAVRRAPAKARNDHFDNVFATYGTYFNGLMTNDHGPLLTQHIVRIILKALGARLATDYVESEYILSLVDEQDAKIG